MTEILQAIPPDMAFYATPPHECSYFADREATTLFADPHTPMTPALYSALAEAGFRRSGQYVYKPRCTGCDACLPARIPVESFRPTRAQRRNRKQNRDLRAVDCPPEFREEQYRLYRRYIRGRHPDGGMDVDSVEQYLSFLTSSWSDTRFIEFRDPDDTLLCVAVVDRMRDGLSAVYTFFDPDLSSRGLGVHAVLWQIEEAARRGLTHVYLGYYLKDSPKMSYKRDYRPLEIYRRGEWRPLQPGEAGP